MRILLLGKNGQLGWELHRGLSTLGDLIAVDYPEIDLTDPGSVYKTILQLKPEAIFNATAYTEVDQAEDEPDVANVINGEAPGLLAEAAKILDAVLIHYSTDYVFDGSKGSAYVETDNANPLNAYGKSKLAGEFNIAQVDGSYLIIRTSWVYSTVSKRDQPGKSFVSKVLSWSREHPTLRIVSDQVGNPTWARVLAEATTQLLAMGKDHFQEWIKERNGIYHLAGDGCASRLQWAQAILRFDPCKEKQVVRELQPALTSEFPTKAQRPLYSALNCEKFITTFGLRLPPWENALELAMLDMHSQ
jgi:dTDP-4-dehydrorhamnose reductase